MAKSAMVYLNTELMQMKIARNGKCLSVLLHMALCMEDGEYTETIRNIAAKCGLTETDVRYALEKLSAEDIIDVDWGAYAVHVTFNQYYVTEDEPEEAEV